MDIDVEGVKNTIFVSFADSINSTQGAAVIYESDYPSEIASIKIRGNWRPNLTASTNAIWVLVNDNGREASTISLVSTTTIYAPERQVLAYGVFTVDNRSAGDLNGWAVPIFEDIDFPPGVKLQPGESIQMLTLGANATSDVSMYVGIQITLIS